MSTVQVELDDATRDALLAAAAERKVTVESLMAGAMEAFAAEIAGPAYELNAEERAGVDQGLAELERGEGVPSERVFADLRVKYGM